MTAGENRNLYQYLAALVANLLPFGYGVSCGWASPYLLVLQSDESPLPTGKITEDEGSYIAALLCVGAFIGNIFFGFITNKYGRKEPLLVLTIPTIVGWVLVLYAQNVYYLYAARILLGLAGGGMYVIIPLFFSEIASDSIRGAMGSTMVLSCGLGILLEFILGAYFDYETTPKFVILSTVAFAIAFSFFPESPSTLLKQNRISQTEKSIRFYRHIRGKADEYEILEFEMNKLKSTYGDTVNGKSKNDNGLKWSDFATKESQKAMTIGIVLAVLNQFCGCFAMINYTAKIFKESGSNLSPNMSSIVVALIQLIGSYCSTILVDRAGRKILYAISAVGTALGLIVLGTYMMLKTQGYAVDEFNWIPIFSFSFTSFISCLGVVSLPFLVISEIMPEKLKNFGASFCMSLLWLSAFILLKYLPLISNTFRMHGSFFLFAACSMLGAVFVILIVPETKGKSYEEIMQSLR